MVNVNRIPRGKALAMKPSLKALGIDRLSIEERIQLVEDLWDDIAASTEAMDIPQSHKDLLDQRLAAHEADPQAGSTWEEVKARISERLGDAE
jgi:putative addiction module component (TIGR02574 family)